MDRNEKRLTANMTPERVAERNAKARETYRGLTAEQRETKRQGVRLRRRRLAGLADATGEAKAGECPVCLRVGRLVVDHCHVSGAFRGWLCDRCNRSFGMMGDTIDTARRLLAYMEAAGRSS